MKVVFVGQGPNRACWQQGLAAGARYALLKHNFAEDDPRVKVEAIAFAERYSARVALTGSVGKKLAALGGWKCNLTFGGYARRNLNARWNGKDGNGDRFERVEAEIVASRMLHDGFTHFVLLGSNVAKAFGMGRNEPLSEIKNLPGSQLFFLLPHPSGINQWWNDDFNRFRARKRLREFLNITNL